MAWCIYRIGAAQRWLGLAAGLLVIGLSVLADANYYAARTQRRLSVADRNPARAEAAGRRVVLDDDRNWPIFEYYFAGGAKLEGRAERLAHQARDVDYYSGPTWQSSEGLWLVWNEDALRIDENHLLEQWLAERSVYRTRFRLWHQTALFFRAHTADRAQTGRRTGSKRQADLRCQ